MRPQPELRTVTKQYLDELYAEIAAHRRLLDEAQVDRLIDDFAATEDLDERKLDLVDCLPERQRDLLYRRLAGDTYPQIGATFGISTQGAVDAIRRARKRLERLATVGTVREKPLLTVTEQRVLEHAAKGATAAETAATLGNGEQTVKTHRKAVLRKLGARDMAHAVFLACRAGLLDQLTA